MAPQVATKEAADAVVDHPVLLELSNESSEGSLTILSKAAPVPWTSRFWTELTNKFVGSFAPVLFASVMGTGMSANLLYKFPYPARWLEICGIIMALIALAIFLFLSFFFLLTLYKKPEYLSKIHRDAGLAPGMGCFVMGYTTLITFLHLILGPKWISGIWVLWWIVVVGSFYTCLVTFYFALMAKHRNSPNFVDHQNINMLYLLPVVTLTVAASQGGAITPDLHSTSLQVATMTVSLIMWALAVLLASIITTINFWRLLVHKIPKSGQVLTMFLPIGFVGQGAYAILLFGQNCTRLLLENNEVVAESSYLSFLAEAAKKNRVSVADLALIMSTSIMVFCAIVAFMLMSFGFLLTVFSYMSVLSKMSPFAVKTNKDFTYQTASSLSLKRVFVGMLKFHRGFWAMTFPIGTMSLAAHEFYTSYSGFSAFRVVATIYAMLVIVTTLGCLTGVAYKGMRMFVTSLTPKVEKPQESV